MFCVVLGYVKLAVFDDNKDSADLRVVSIVSNFKFFDFLIYFLIYSHISKRKHFIKIGVMVEIGKQIDLN